MISLIARKYGNSKDYMLSVRVKSAALNTAVALGISVGPQRWEDIDKTIKAARKAYRRGTTIFIDDQLTSNLWQLVKRLIVEDKAKMIDKQSIEKAITDTLRKDERAAMDEVARRKHDEVIGILSPKKDRPSFHEYLDKYIEDLSNGTRLRQRSSQRVAKHTLLNFGTLKTNITEYEAHSHVTIDWQDINIAFFQAFSAYLASVKMLKANTVATYLQKLRTLLRTAKRLHYTANDDFESPEWFPQFEEVNNVYVTAERISQLYNAPLEDEKWLTRHIETVIDDQLRMDLENYLGNSLHRKWLVEARDLFVLGCLTGQRYSDYKRITSDMYYLIDGKKFLHLRQEKTHKEVYVPVDHRVEAILGRNGGHAPHIDRKKFCDLIRTIGLLMGWTENVPCTVSQGSLSYEQDQPFYKLLKTHTCRRSFATNAYRAKVPLSAIMAVTGHSTEDMLRRYLKLSNKERALFAAEELAKMGAL